MGRPRAERAADPTKPTCLRPDCPNPVYQRGLCKNEHDIARGLVARGVVTWAALEEAGKALPFTRSGPPSPGKDWLLDGVERDGCGRAIREAVDDAITGGMPPLELWETHLRGWTKAGVTKSIRYALARLAAKGVRPVCRCGRRYEAPHDRAEPCDIFPAPPHPPKAAPASRASLDVPPPVPRVTDADVDQAVQNGVPPRLIGVLDSRVQAAMERVRAAGHALWCRCGREYSHRGECRPKPVNRRTHSA